MQKTAGLFSALVLAFFLFAPVSFAASYSETFITYPEAFINGTQVKAGNWPVVILGQDNVIQVETSGEISLQIGWCDQLSRQYCGFLDLGAVPTGEVLVMPDLPVNRYTLNYTNENQLTPHPFGQFLVVIPKLYIDSITRAEFCVMANKAYESIERAKFYAIISGIWNYIQPN